MVTTRFCPSPTGHAHLGNIRTALFNALLALRDQGDFLLRIEDTDRERSKPEFAEDLLEDLLWLGLEWQQGPRVGGATGPYYQNDRIDIYNNYFDLLKTKGRVYPCYCSPEQLAMARKSQLAAGQPPKYPGTCLHLSDQDIQAKEKAGLKPSLRFHIEDQGTISFHDLIKGPQQFLCEDLGDFIIARSDGTPAFLFTNAVDDSLMGVTHALRGEDHLTNTPRQLLILQALGLRAPQYGHMNLIVGPDGSPLSKRHGSKSLRTLAQQGYLPWALINYLARLGHRYESDDFMSLTDLAKHFQLEHCGVAPARFDANQLLYWQKQALLSLNDEGFSHWAKSADMSLVPADQHQAFFALVKPNVHFIADIECWARRLFAQEVHWSEEAQKAIQAAGATALATMSEAMATAETYTEALALIKSQTDLKGKSLFMPIRMILTDCPHGPELPDVVSLIGMDRAHKRFQQACQWSQNSTP